METARVILWIGSIYSLIGVAFALAFAIRGAGAVDPVAKQAGILFRLLILPASAALWPLMLSKWLQASKQERNA
jgi:hypothetical protein